ncbi:MAG: T9SS type A sorting domain-containing protein [candidate division Zixibacteria bacterium]|nr:T9SS type A sorting domain-containing protein [candidate division Zixibacteria bacterium]
MKKTIFLSITILLFALNVQAQLLNGPESIVFDYEYNRWLVSNWMGSSIVEIDSNGNQSYFKRFTQSCGGSCIVEDTLYSASAHNVRGVTLNDGEVVMNINIPGTILLNCIASDDSGNLYITDANPGRIYKVDVSEHSYSVFLNGQLSLPVGLYYDSELNRLLVTTLSGNESSIYAVSLNDTSVSLVVVTEVGYLDAITEDSNGNYYVSASESNRVYKFDHYFSNPPELFSSGHNWPSQLFCNQRDNILAVPNFYANRIDFINLDPTDVHEVSGSTKPEKTALFSNYPNPFNSSTTISYTLNSYSLVELDIYNIMGRKIESLVNKFQQPGQHEVLWLADNRSSGIYFYIIKTAGGSFINKMVLMK